jgi:chromosomal replication initiator protein
MVVSSYYNITPSALRGKRRAKQVILPRQVAVYLTRELTSLPLKEIGRQFGGRDHSTIIHDYDKIKVSIVKDDKLRNEVIHIKKLITGE